MKKDRDNIAEKQETGNQKEQKEQKSSAFNERNMMDEKSTTNPEEEADLEQERKEAMTERD